MAQTTRPQLVQPRITQALEAVRSVTSGGTFDVDFFHVINERDNQLVADEILHGAGSELFVYSFQVQGQEVSGVSVVGARHLAAHYKGLKHRLVASAQKTGSLFIFQSFPGEGTPMAVSASTVPELENEPDFYSAVVELSDLKSGNSLQIERREFRFERRRDGSQYERPNYQTIAQSKAYRNAVLSIVPQDIVVKWKQEMLRLKKGEIITSSVLAEKRSGVLRYAASHALGIDRHAVERLSLDEIAGLGVAAREGHLPAFVSSARALGLDLAVGQGEPEPASGRGVGDTPQAAEAPRRRGRPPGTGNRHRQETEDEQSAQPAEDEQQPTTTRANNIPDIIPEATDEAPADAQPPPRRRVDFEC